MERTLILFKPDALQRGIVGEILSRFEKKGLKIVAMKMLRMSQEKVREHYKHLVDKPFFPSLAEFMTKPIIAAVLEGKDAVAVVRKMVGTTNAREAAPGTIRGDYSMSISKNVIHASESRKAAEEEIRRFFDEKEIFPWEREEYWYYAEDEVE